MKAFVLAGGFATRLWPLTNKRAKPLLPLAGKPILNHIVENIPAGIDVYVSTNAAFKEGFEHWKERDVSRPVDIVIEQTAHDDQKLGALGALAQWIEMNDINDDLLILTGDNYLTFNLQDFIETQKEGTPLIAAYDIEDLEQAKAFGTVILEDDQTHVAAFEEKPKEPKSTLVNTGCCIIPKEHLRLLMDYAKQKPDDLGGIFEHMMDQNLPLHCYTFSGLWFDIGSFQAYLDATKAIVKERIHTEEAAEFDAQSVSQGSVVLGPRSTVHRSNLTNVIVFEDCTIEDCTLENCIIDRGSLLRGIDLEGKMLQEETIIQIQ